jgi:hypothetical protein
MRMADPPKQVQPWIYQASMRARSLEISEEQRRRSRMALREINLGTSGCNAHTTRCPDARDLSQDTPACCLGHVRRVMADLAALMDGAGITWWADYGTLLGYVRNGGMIPFDKDGDLGILATDRDKLLSLMPVLMQKGYFVRYTKPHSNRFRSGDRVKVCLSQRNHTNVDIFIWHRRPKGMLDRTNYIAADVYKGREMPEAWVLPTQRGEWDGIDIAVPADPERLAEHRYGPGWQTPRREKHPKGVRT